MLLERAMNGLPEWFKFSPPEFLMLEDVGQMNPRQAQACLWLIVKSWNLKPPCTLPADDAALCRIVGWTAPEWAESRNAILSGWRTRPDGRLEHPWIVEHFEYGTDVIGKRIRAGQARHKTAHAQHMLSTNQHPVCLSVSSESLSSSLGKSQEKGPGSIVGSPGETGGVLGSPTGTPPGPLWDRNAAAKEIASAYPPSNAHRPPGAVRLALYALGGTSGTARFPSEQDAAEWLLGRVRAFAASPLMQTTPQQYRPALSNWLRSEGYDSPDEDWATPYQNGEAAPTPAVDTNALVDAVFAKGVKGARGATR